MPVRIGVNTWVWCSPLTTDELARIAPRVAEMGFDIIELPIEAEDGFDYREARSVASGLGLGVTTCAVIGPDRDLISPDESVRAGGAAYVRHCVDAAVAMGSASVAGPLYSGVGRTWQSSPDERARDMELLVSQLRPLAEYAGDHGVTLCLEPLNRFETSFINLTAQGVEVVDLVDHPALGLLLDTFHMNIEERSLGEAIRAAGHRLRHLHACENDRGAPGSGHVPWTEVASACREIGYDGPVVIESFTSEVKSIARAAAVWRPFAESQDDLASDGLRFLRELFRDT
jgi:D-psicose/D-tagatose/L-ribulose 3-epimerase